MKTAAFALAAAAAAGGLALRMEALRELAPRPARAGWDLSRFHCTSEGLDFVPGRLRSVYDAR